MALPGTCRYAPQTASGRPVSGDARAESEAGARPRPRVDFLHNVLLMINHGHLLFDDGNLVLKDPRLLEAGALRRYFKYSKKLSTFERQLYRFGFRKLARRGKLEPQVFYNNTLKGKNAEAILNLQRGSSVARRSTPAATASMSTSEPPMSTSEPSLSKHSDSHLGSVASSSTSSLTSLNAKSNGQNLGSENTQRFGTSTGGGGQRKRASRSLSRKKRRTDSAMVSNGRKGQDNSGGSEGGALGVGSDPRKPDTIESQGSREVSVRRRSGRTFSGWQRPLPQKDGNIGSGGSGGISVGSQGEVTKGPTAVCAKRGESNHERDDDGDESSALTMRRPDGRNDSDSGGGGGGGGGGSSGDRGEATTTSIHNLFTAIQLEINDRRGRSYAAEQFNGHAESGSSVVDLASTMAPQGCPATAVTGSQAPGSHFDTPSVKLSLAARGSFPLPSVAAQHPDMEADVAFRRPLHNREAEFAGKNFGDSILGECGVTEGPRTAVGSHDWSVRVGYDSYGGGGADAVAARSGRQDPGSTGPALYGKDLPKASGREFGGVLSPNQLPSTPSPLSLDRPPYHSMHCLMGL